MSRSNLYASKTRETDDVVRASLSEIILFLLFFFLILLGENNEVDTSKETKEFNLKEELYLKRVEVCVLQGDVECAEQLLEQVLSQNQFLPVFDLADARGFSFDLGSPNPTQSFITNLESDITPRIIEIIQDPQFDIQAIEIIGHTDKSRIWRSTSNIDTQLELHLDNAVEREPIQAGDNAGLGLARALAVRNLLLQNEVLADFPIHVLSAAYAIAPDIAEGEELTDRQRRRIEIRLRSTLPVR